MSKVIQATCAAGVVTADGVPVTVATILSQGLGTSSGYLIIDGDKAWYVPKTSPDLDTTLQKVIDALGAVTTSLDKVVTALTKTATIDASLGAAFTSNSLTPPPTLAADLVTQASNITAVTAAEVAITTAKTALTTLKAALK